MIPDLPEGLSVEQELDFYERLLETNESQGLVHLHWYSHKRDPSLCWQCDRGAIAHKMVQLVERLLSKSDTDIETGLVQEIDSDTEIENDLNVNEEPEGVDVLESEE